MYAFTVKQIRKGTHATVTVPGSKSYTNRALFIAALTPGSVKIHKPLMSDDTRAMLSCLKTLDIQVTESQKDIVVKGDISDIKAHDVKLDANLSGTTMRFMLALAAILPGNITLTGGAGLQKRPIADMVDALRAAGAKIEYLKTEGYPPLRVCSSELKTEEIHIRGNISSQYLSALLMISPMLNGTTLTVSGDDVVSKPYIDMTIDIMEKFNIHVIRKGYRSFRIPESQTYSAEEYTVEGDVSSASYFFAMAALNQCQITVTNVASRSKQADMAILKILSALGSTIVYRENSVQIRGSGVSTVQVDMENCPDQAPTVAVLAAFAKQQSTITGIQSLRVKETERIVALETELEKMGIKTSSTHDSLTVNGGIPKPAEINTYGDHRMAMSFAVAGTKLSGMIIDDPHVVAKTFPDFWQQLNILNERTLPKDSNIVLIGMRGSGKSTIALQLAQALNREFLDTDQMIVRLSGKRIPEIVAQDGWDTFRSLEADTVQRVATLTNKVIATGGGVVLNPSNIRGLRKSGVVIWLEASIDSLLSRLADMYDRPALTDQATLREELQQLQKQRHELYLSYADVIIHSDNQVIAETIADIRKALEDLGL